LSRNSSLFALSTGSFGLSIQLSSVQTRTWRIISSRSVKTPWANSVFQNVINSDRNGAGFLIRPIYLSRQFPCFLATFCERQEQPIGWQLSG
jgi:hypothetical protein